MTEPLAIVIATALQEARRLDEERVRELVREELAKAPGVTQPVRPGWSTLPKAAKWLGVPRKRAQRLVRAGRVKTRLCDPTNVDAKRIEVNLASLEVALSGDAMEPPINLARARARGGK